MSDPKSTTRRTFLRESGRFGTGVALTAWTAARSRAAGVAPSDRLRLAVVGIRGRGGYLAQQFASRPDCEVAYLCDVDESLFPIRTDAVEQAQGAKPQTITDFRHALDDKSIDAIIVATPDHWHALATIWGCQAGKDVYCEKPVSHSPWEGRKMVEAARKYDRIVQVGMQTRSGEYTKQAKAYIESGELGKLYLVRVINQKEWLNPAIVPSTEVPAGLNWDMWTGPAEMAAYNENLHRSWNHFWRFSGGDIINDAVHQMDTARFLIGKPYPETVYSTGGRYGKEGAFETPDTQVAVFQYDDLVMTFDLTLDTPYMIKSDQELRDSDTMYPYWMQNAERIELYGSKGLMLFGRHGAGWQVYDRPRSRNPVVASQANGPFPDPEHFQNFCDSVRNRTLPNADIEEGHRSTFLCQAANISYRLGGRKLEGDGSTEPFKGDPEANSMLKREYRGPWIVPEVV
ncbi:MAG TPA: Gfo/Idh/MocA family oxidoreductase [Lacipirellulaceae bacterium]|nr:Gfo/Idh/MocA family oxidoreductase [Lacipirellulaceae bacterium]